MAETIEQEARALARLIEARSEDVIEILSDYESHLTARDEIARSIETLDHIREELAYLTAVRIHTLCAFFPVNLPLYSLILFAVVPRFMCDAVCVRPPISMRAILARLVDCLDLGSSMPEIRFSHWNRQQFVDAYVRDSDAVIFTGKHQNAQRVHRYCPGALMIYNGAGVNPLVVTRSADVSRAAHKTVEMRTFNSGQDCAGPDAILVDQAVAAPFVDELMRLVRKIKVGQYADPEVTVGPLQYEDSYQKISGLLKQVPDDQVRFGGLEKQSRIIPPTVLFGPLASAPLRYEEFFAPIFNVLSFEDESELRDYFTTQHYEDYAMYVSLFGQLEEPFEFPNSITLHDKIVNDVERGNEPYGGYGRYASYAAFGSRTIPRPMLISREIAEAFGPKPE
jgi:acyl-CoA reductase-like NAD-dependent aldehyde dehydrogenase